MARLLGFNVLDCTKEKYLETLIEKYDKGTKTVIVSGNPEVLYNANQDESMASLCRESDIIPDGIGVIIAGKLSGQPFREKIAGIDVMTDILSLSKQHDMKIYLLGAEGWVVEQAQKACMERYDSLVVGYHDGFFDIDNCTQIINEINEKRADVVFVAMGCPRQEIFINKYKGDLKAKIFMGVGGSFDVLAGKANRAPQWMVKAGLEWLYRVSKEPYRIVRLTSIPRFLFKAVLRGKK